MTGLPFNVAQTITAEADRYGLDLMFALGVMHLESRFDVNAINYNTNGTVDTGLMQINSRYADWMASSAGLESYDLTDPHDNIKIGFWYLSYLNEQCEGDKLCTLSKYNGDSTGVYAQVAEERIMYVASRMTEVSRSRLNQDEALDKR